MTRKLTGSTLAAVFIAIIAVKHLALGFCLCNDALFVTECPCECSAEAAPPAPCCEQDECPTEAPCDDCVVTISLDAGNFFWSADTFQSAQQAETAIKPSETPFQAKLHATDVTSLGAPVRGSPPGGPPVFLRTTVLRL